MKRTAIYLRVSSDRQAREGDSIPAQRAALRTYINDRPDLTFVGEYLDDGISGTKYSQRDELQRLLEDVEADKIDLIAFVKLDRWFRSVRHYLNTQAILDAHGVSWVAIWEHYETQTPQGRLMVNQMLSFAQFEAENTGQRIRQVQAYKIAQGEVISGSTPAGYSIVDKHLVPNEDAQNVLEAFRTFDRTGSINATMRKCIGLHGLPTSQPPLKKMLMNRIYIGEHPRNPNFCEPIVPRDLFERVQQNLTKNVKSNVKHIYIFSGLIRCAECGGAFGANTRKRQRGGGKVQIIPQYRCAKHFNRKPSQCPNSKLITENVLENYLIDHLRDKVTDLIVEYKTAPVRDNSKQIAEIHGKIKRLKELYVNDLISIDEYKADRERYLEQIAKLEQDAQTQPQTDLDALQGLLSTNFEEIYWDMSKAEKRRFWRSILKEIRFDMKRNIDLYF